MAGRPRTVVPAERLAEAFRRFTDEGWSTEQFGRFLRVNPTTARALLKGERQPEVPRPEGFAYTVGVPRVDKYRERREAVRKALEVYVADPSMTLRQFADSLGISKAMGSLILLGNYFKDVPRPEGFVYRQKQDKE